MMSAVKEIPVKKSNDFDDMVKKRVDPKGVRAERYAMEESWLRAMAFFSGKQNWGFDGGGRLVDRDPLDDEQYDLEIDYKVNELRKNIMRAVSMVLATNVKFDVLPQSDSIKHRHIAKVTKQVFQHLRSITGYDDQLSLSASMWAAICGSSFVKVWWDSLAGEADRFYISNKKTREIEPRALWDADLRLDLERQGMFEDYHQGDVRGDILSPFAAYHDWSARDGGIKACQWFAEKHWVDKDIAAERLEMDADDLPADAESQGVRNYEDAIAFMSATDNMGPYNYLEPIDKRGQRVMWVDMWQRPNRQYPRGLRIIHCGGSVRRVTENPNIADKSGLLHIPFIKQDWAPHPGRFWGFSLAEDMTGLQWHLNRARTSQATFLHIFGNPPTFVGSNSGIDPRQVSVRPGRTYMKDENSSGIEFGPTPHLPAEIFAFGDVVSSDLRSIASQSDMDASKLPGQVRSGAGMEAIARERHIALSIPAKQWAIATRDFGKMGLKLMQMHYDEPRLATYVGEDGSLAVKKFLGADLSTDLVIVGEPSITDTRESRRAEVLDAVQVGALQPAMNPEDRILFLKAMHYDTSDAAISPILAADTREEILIEHIKANPQYFPVMDWENHEEGAAAIQRYMQSEEFETLDSKTQAAIAVRWKEHTQHIQSAVMNQLQMQALTKGAPGQKGAASQPRA
jgi:hypothetical protein